VRATQSCMTEPAMALQHAALDVAKGERRCWLRGSACPTPVQVVCRLSVTHELAASPTTRATAATACVR
jgi:hypothetical protein